MKGEWCYWKSHFSPELCQKILQDAETLPMQDARVGAGQNGEVKSSTRRSRVKFISKQQHQFAWLFDELWKLAISANADFFNIHITKLDFLQLAEYNETDQGEYREHQDVFWLNNDPVLHRKLSCIIQLTDSNAYEGGDFVMTEVSEPLPPHDIRQQGSVIFFPGMLRHAAMPVTRGVRHSIAAWFEGPKWR